MNGDLKILLPKFDFWQYELLMNSLQYYRNSATEFSVDGDTLNDIYVLISIIQEKMQVIH